MSVRYVAFGAAGRAFNGCREGQFDECGVVLVDTISQNHPLMAGDAIPMGLSEIRK